MKIIDWILLLLTFSGILLYGIYKNRKDKNLDGYLLGNRSLPWYHVGFSLMATQASAITFLSAPGEGYANGMAFVQFYLGLPLAMIVLSITFVPIFHRLKVYTAYEFLQTRFDNRVRIFTAVLFLLSRGLATGLAIYAPAIIVSTLFHWDLTYTNILLGGIVLLFTTIGGTKAISHTHFQQMMFMTVALLLASFFILALLPDDLTVVNGLKMAGKAGKMNVLSLDPEAKYNLWSGLIGGFFLQLSYFGTDQSQVGRFLTGRSVSESRTGLMMNGFVKIPMQFFIILIGVFVFIFYLFNETPAFHNTVEVKKLTESAYAQDYYALEARNRENSLLKKQVAVELNHALEAGNTAEADRLGEQLNHYLEQESGIRSEVASLIRKSNPGGNDKDINFVFLNFVMNKLPHGFIGILIAVIICASIGAIASALSALAATSITDVIKVTGRPVGTEEQELKMTKALTVLWGILIILVAIAVQRSGSSMIELVNVIGSWFYGVILGVFIIAFYFRRIGPAPVFYAAVIAQVLVIVIWYFFTEKHNILPFLWLNPIGVILVVGMAFLLQQREK
ncbi:sodium:solute symporter [Leadbetterella sp. DM7]|uniref:sodium:solute symporter n=1 Tax=Leadbetterella sp. DM7 TaxID=3235085 RepID=UPI00349EDFDB